MGHDCSMNALQEVKELVRGTRQAVGSNFLGSLESFLVYLESLMDYCKMFLADSAAEAVMKVWGRHGSIFSLGSCVPRVTGPSSSMLFAWSVCTAQKSAICLWRTQEQTLSCGTGPCRPIFLGSC